ncbi:peroxisomal membrane anchor protein conserved region-domain-containing protein [Circinella umbellata]|nr:peroxisomal membrane anchor protein conserved region-domain-containing protein [Circinella umbellata]
MADETNNNIQQPSTENQQDNKDNKPLNEQLIKSAVSFLSSPNVKSAETVKKVAFLKNKGLSAEEIQEAFKRVDDVVPTISTPVTNCFIVILRYSITYFRTTGASTTLPAAGTATLTPPAPLIPKRSAYNQQQPSIIYQPLPGAPSMSIQRLLAIALIFGVGAVGVTSGIVGIVKRLLLPTFNGVTSYRSGRYKQQKSILDKLSGQLAGESTLEKEVEKGMDDNNSNKDDEKKEKEDKKEEQTSVENGNDNKQEENRVDLSKQLAEKQEALADQLAHMVSRTQARYTESKDNVDLYRDFGSSVVDLRNTINKPEYMHTPSLYATPAMGLGGNEPSPAVHGLKSEIRSLKGILLNRRRIN